MPAKCWPKTSSVKHPFRILLAACAALFYFPLAQRALWDSDEGRYAEIAREMIELKSWLVPHLNHVLYFEKPPLFYWLTAIAMHVFGENAFAARFWSATFALLTVGLVYSIGRHWKNERTGLLSASILATSFLFYSLTQFLVLDMALTFWLTLALLAESRLVDERLTSGRQGAPEKANRFAYLLAVACAGGLLTKGLIALVLPLGIGFFVVIYLKLGHTIRRIQWKGPALLFLALAAPWFILVTLRHPFFATFFFVHEHFQRYLTTVHHREAPFYFFIPVLLAGFLPWAVFLPKVVSVWVRQYAKGLHRDPGGALFIAWILLITLFFSMSSSKLVAYILPVFPALALLTGALFDSVFEEERMPHWLRGGIVSLIALYAILLLIMKWPEPPEFLLASGGALLHARGLISLVLGGGIFIFVGVWGMRRTDACFGGVMVTQAMLLSVLINAATHFDPYLSAQGLGMVLRDQATPDQKIVAYGVSWENRLQSLVFYSRRRVAVYGDRGELEMGLSHDSDAAEWSVPAEQATEALLQLPVGSWVVTSSEALDRLKESQPAAPFTLVAQQGTLRLLQKR